MIILLSICCKAQIINISTGLGNVKTNETNWKVGTIVPASNTPYISVPDPGWNWQAQPVVGTSAKWIAPTSNWGSGKTTYYYERKITVTAGKKWLKYQFNIAADDELKSIELVRPNSETIDIPFTVPTNPRIFFKEFLDSIPCPEVGDWKLRIKVFCTDLANTNGDGTGLLLSGYANLIDGVCNPPNPCCPPWDTTTLKKFMRYEGSGSAIDPYTLKFVPSQTWMNQMQMYLNYIHSVSPCNSQLTIDFRIHDQGTGTSPSASGWGPQIGSTGYVNFTWNTTGIGAPTGVGGIFFSGYNLQVGHWYAIPTGIYTNCNPCFFNVSKCNNGGNITMYVRLQVLAAKVADGRKQPASLQFSDGKNITATIPL